MARHPKHPYPRSERTIFPRHDEVPLRGKRFDEAKEAEKAIKKADPYYMTAEEARALPPEAADNPEVRSRIAYSRDRWPENRAAASVALGPLAPGEGEVGERHSVPAEDLFKGGPVGDGE